MLNNFFKKYKTQSLLKKKIYQFINIKIIGRVFRWQIKKKTKKFVLINSHLTKIYSYQNIFVKNNKYNYNIFTIYNKELDNILLFLKKYNIFTWRGLIKNNKILKKKKGKISSYVYV